MEKKNVFILIILPLFCFGQSDNRLSPFAQGCTNIRTERIMFFKDDFNMIDALAQFCTRLDTFVFRDGYYGVGHRIVDIYDRFDGCQVGEWTYYYPSGALFSRGQTSIGAYTECQSGGPIIMDYGYKTGEWEYWYEVGTKMAIGIYKPSKKIVKTNCGNDTLMISTISQEWKYFGIDGVNESLNIDELIQKIDKIYGSSVILAQ